MKRSRFIPLIASAGLAFPAFAQRSLYTDPVGDATLRRTDAGNNGPVPAALPDLVRLVKTGWQSPSADTDPYTGSVVPGEHADLARIDLVFAGLVNPPGTLGLAGQPWDPFRFGTTPLLGFVEFDTDRDKDTGGQLGGGATLRYLANAARFGGRPYSSVGERAAESADDYDTDFFSAPQYERSGEDFAIVLCGCFETTIVSQSGNADGIFDPGETWIVRGRFFQRAAGYQDASAVFGGSDFGLYDPIIDMRFHHDPLSDETTLTLVIPLTMRGAALLTGEPEQPIDSEIGPFSHWSVEEAIQDVIDGADGLNGWVPPDTQVLIERREGREAADDLDAADWDANALIGTSYTVPQDSLYVWTDLGFECTPNDFDGDGMILTADQQLLDAEIAARDGTASDADGTANGVVVIPNFGTNFSLFDVNADGVITPDDFQPPCPADLTGSADPNDPAYGTPNGIADSDDFFYFLDAFVAGSLGICDLTGSADPNSPTFGDPDGDCDADDFFLYLDRFVVGCP
ncbi:MAG: GC-type dockerin domain-anchored protein [Phycisphaerales bacterium JB037]